MYSTHLRVGKTFAAEQKIRELKKKFTTKKTYPSDLAVPGTV